MIRLISLITLIVIYSVLVGFQWPWQSKDQELIKALNTVFQDKKVGQQFFEDPQLMNTYLLQKGLLTDDTINLLYVNIYIGLKVNDYFLRKSLYDIANRRLRIKTGDTILQASAYLLAARDLMTNSREDKKQQEKYYKFTEGYLARAYIDQTKAKILIRSVNVKSDDIFYLECIAHIVGNLAKSIDRVDKRYKGERRKK